MTFVRNVSVFRVGGCLTVLLTLGWILTIHAKPYEQGLPTDWTHQHVIFSQPRTAEQVAQVTNDPRYWQQWIRHHMVRVLPEVNAPGNASLASGFRAHTGDWSVSMGNNASVGAGNFPAKYSFSTTTANCANAAKPDYVVFSTGLQSAATTASIIAMENLYSGCPTGGVPTLYWAYNTTVGAVAGTVRTSPVLSLDGSQIAFVQTDGTHGTLILLKWKPNNGTLAAPVAPANVPASSYTGCTIPCMTAFPLKTSGGTQTDDTTSSVYYDYTNDTAWVGDGSGLLHKFSPVFKATPAEVTTGWPVAADAAHASALTSPVYDHVSNNVFVGDAAGYVSAVNAASGAPTVSGQVDHSAVGIVSSPILDQTAQKIYVFAASNGGGACGGGPCAIAVQFSTTFSAGAAGSRTTLGSSSANPNPLYAGAFDSAYYASNNATGNLYGCGHTGANPILYQIPINAGAMPAAGTVLVSTTTNGSTASCSPITDILNPNLAGGFEERLFVSPQNNGRFTACGGKGCVESFIDTPWQPSTNYAVGQIILTPKIHTEIVITAGTSSTSPPTWTTTAGTTVNDGGVTWLDQGVVTANALPVWTKNHAYALAARILGTGGKIEIVTGAGTTNNTAEPTWPSTPGTTTVDGSVTWIYAGPLPTAALQVTGGSSGIIMDNVVSSGTLAGASQIYFSTLANQACTIGGNGGCAVQTSQSALQ